MRLRSRPTVRPSARARRGDGGFTLIELMIALFIFGLLASGFAMTMGTTLTAFQRARVKTLGEQIAGDKLEDIRRMPYTDVGNVGGNPLGTIPFTQTQKVGGYQFTVAIDVAYVDDPAPNWARTSADYKVVAVTVTSTTGGPPVKMSTFVAPPLKPAPDRGQVTVTVNDVPSRPSTTLANVSVRLMKATTSRTDTTNTFGWVVFPDLPPSSGSSDYYWVTGTPPAGYWVYPTSDYTRTCSKNKFLLAAGVNTQKNFDVYKGATVVLTLTDSRGNVMHDPATVTVSANSPDCGSLGSTTYNFADGANASISTVGGIGIIPDGKVSYTFQISAAGCSTTVTDTEQLTAANYPADTSVPLVEQMWSCTDDVVRLTPIDDITGQPLPAGTQVVLTGGPLSINRTLVTDATGSAQTTVRASDTTQYKATVPAHDGYVDSSLSFYANLSTPSVAKDVRVKWQTKTITVNVTDDFTETALSGATVQAVGGPGNTTFTATATSTAGQYKAVVPCGTFTDYVVNVLPDTVGRAGATATASAACGSDVTLALADPWATTMSVTLHVTDVNGNPVNAATITLSGGPPALSGYHFNPEARTNSSGDVTITVPAGLATPDYVAFVDAPGHPTATQSFTSVAPGPGTIAITVS